MRALLVSLLLIAGSQFGGCSVALALHGQPEPDLSAITIGATRGDVELQPLVAIEQTVDQYGYTSVDYEYELGNESAPGRALAHAALDVFTFGFWEIAGTTIEVAQGSRHHMTITYDPQGRVASINQPLVTREEDELAVVSEDPDSTPR